MSATRGLSAWKEQVRQDWQEIGLEDFCARVGIDFQETFEHSLDSTSALDNPYNNYRWEIPPNTRIRHGVLHLVPKSITDLPVLWEEWFLEAGLIHHHVLRNHPHDLATGTWFGENTDMEHPKEVLRVQWHHSNDIDLRPTRFR